jgi:hypothetical protein
MPAAVSVADMDRRTLLRGVAALVTGGAVAGCAGNNREVPVTAPPAPPEVDTSGGEVNGVSGFDGGNDGGDSGLDTGGDGSDGGASEAIKLQDFNYVEGEEGALLITMVVRNEGLSRNTAYVRATVRLGTDVRRYGEFVTLTPGESATVEVTADVSYDQFSGNGGIDFDVLARTPATPIPSESPTPTPTAVAANATDSGGSTAGRSTTEDDAADTGGETVGDDTASETGTQ